MKRFHTGKMASVVAGALAVWLAGCGGADEGFGEEIGTIEAPLTQGQRETAITAKFIQNSQLLISPTSGFTHFSNGARRDYSGAGNNSSIYIGDAVGDAHMVLGFIRSKYLAKSAQAGVLGYPTSDEGNTAFPGKFNFFQGGRILWKSGASQAFEVHGAIDGVYKRLGMEWGLLGFPTSDEYYSPYTPISFPPNTRWKNDFEFGKIYRTSHAWPVLTANNVNDKLVARNHPRITEASITRTQRVSVGCVNANGAGFPPGANVGIFTTSPYGVNGSGSTTVASNGTFVYKDSGGCTGDIRSVGGFTTVMARVGSNGATAVRWVSYSGINTGEL